MADTKPKKTRRQTNGKKGDHQDHEVELRQKKAFDLWKEGVYDYRAIGKMLKAEAEKEGRSTRGYSHENIRQDIKAVRARMQEEFMDEVEDWRCIQLMRLSEMYMHFNSAAKGRINPDTNRREPNVDAGRLVLGIVKEINEITGAKSAIKHEVTGQDGKPISLVTNVILEFTDEKEPNGTD